MRVEGGGSGWLSESQMDYQLIRIIKKAAPGVVVVEEEEGGGGEGWEIESMEGGERCRGGGEVRRGERELDFLGVQSRAARLVVSIRAGLEMASSSSSSSSSKLQLFTHRWKESLVYHRRAGVAWNSYQMMLRQARLLLTHTQTHTRLCCCCCCCIGVTHRLSHQPGFGCLFAVWYQAAELLIGLKNKDKKHLLFIRIRRKQTPSVPLHSFFSSIFLSIKISARSWRWMMISQNHQSGPTSAAASLLSSCLVSPLYNGSFFKPLKPDISFFFFDFFEG